MTVLAFMAVLPAAVLLYVIYKADNVEKEPFGLMAFVFFLGVVSTISAMILETIGTGALDLAFRGDNTNLIYIFLMTFFVVGVAEEGGKFLALKLSTWKNKEFNFSFDGIVYSVCASLGFATLENILYVFEGGFSVAVMRAILSVPGHCIFGVFMGVYYGIAKGNELRGNMEAMKVNLRKAFWIPVAIHGFYDFCLMANLELALLAFIGLEIFMVVRAIKLVKLMSKTDTPLIPGVTAQEAINIRNMQAMQEANPAQVQAFQQAMAMQGAAQGMQAQPFANAQQPYANAQQPYANAQQPYANAQQPYANAQQPYANAQQPFVNAQQPYANAQQPYVNAQQSYTQTQGGYNPVQNGAQPQYNAQAPVQNNAQPQYTQAVNANNAQASADNNVQTTVVDSTAVTEELFDSNPDIIIQNEPLTDGLSNPDPTFTATDLG